MAYPNSLYAGLDNGSDAVWGNVNKIAQMFAPPSPEEMARAEAFRRDRELFPLKKQGLEAELGLTNARTASEAEQLRQLQGMYGLKQQDAQSAIDLRKAQALTEGAQRGYYGAQSNLLGSKTQGQQIQNSALGQLFQGASPTAQAAPSGDLTGLPEQLSPLAGAFKQYGDQYGVDPRLLAAISMHETGGGKSNAFINKRNAMGVSDANGPIAFDSPELSVERMARVLANPKGPYAGRNTISGIGQVYAPVGAGNDPGNLNPHWAQGVSRFYQQLGGDPNAPVIRSGTGGQIDPQRAAVLASVGGVNPEQLVTGLARAQALSGGPLTEDRGRQLALAQGLLPSQTTTITPEYQNQVLSANDKAEMDKAMATEAARGKVDLAKQDIAGRYGIAGDILKGAFDQMRPSGTRGTSQGQGGALSFGNTQDLYREAADTSMANFGVPMTEDGKGFDTSKDVFGPYRELWASSYSDLRQAGADPWTAKAQANLHHFGTSEPAGMLDPGGRFFGEPKIKQFNTQPFPADRLRAFGGAQRQPLQGGQLDMTNVAGLLQLLGLAEPAQQQAPSPVAAAIPQTGLPQPPQQDQGRFSNESYNKPTPIPRDFAVENDQRKAAEKQAVGTKYNTEILRRLQSQMQRSGVSLADLANSAFSTGQKPELALQEALTAGPVPPTGGSISDYMAYTQGADVPDLADIQMALRDAAALHALGFDPNQVIPFIPAQFGGTRGIAETTQQPTDYELRAQKY